MAAAIPEPGQPRLTVEAFAELINMPGYNQLRVLNDQKYPKRAPAAIRTPYYQDAMQAIRQFYHNGNNLDIVSGVIIKLQDELEVVKIPQTVAKINRNIAVLQAFRDGPLKDRAIKVQPNRKLTLVMDGVEIRFNPDINGLEGSDPCYFIFNPRTDDASEEMARMTVELAHHLLVRNGVECRVRDVEYVNLMSGQAVRTNTVRKRTLDRAAETASIVKRLWDTI